jgi:hypothetical protein
MHKSLESGACLLLVCALVACGSESGDLFTAAGAAGSGGTSSGSGGNIGSGGNSGDGGSGAEAGSAAGGTSGSGSEGAGPGGSSGDAGDSGSADGGVEDGASGAAGTNGASGAPSDGSADGSAGVGSCASPVTYYADNDKDGHGDLKAPLRSCAQPAGYVTSSDDCYDGNKQANPNQAGWFTVDRGDGSYDYDCDGTGAPRYPEVGRCQSLAICMATPGWQGEVAPCGQEKAWITDCTFPLCTPPITERRKQECH